MSDANVLKVIKTINRVYRLQGFRIRYLLADGAFESMRADLAVLGITLNTTARDEHVGKIERYIRTVKERVRSYYHSLPFRRLPRRLIMEMVKAAVFWLNNVPSSLQTVNAMSPYELVTGR